MTNRARLFRIGPRLLSGLVLTLAGLGLANPAAPAALAAPQAAGTFTVSSTADSNANDPFLTLREALLVARGGTGAAGLNRPASSGEKTALGGCSFDGGNFINGGCGPAIADSIVFSAGLGLHPVISLTASLPAITDTAATTIDGSIHGVFPIVSAAAILTNTDALLISSNNNALSGLTFTGAPRDDLHITGDSNQVLTDTVLLKAGRYGLLMDGGRLNFAESVLVGTSSPAVGVCSQGNQQGGIVVTNAATTNTVQLATVACNTGFGVRFDGVGTTENTITHSTITAQSGNGIEIVNGAGNGGGKLLGRANIVVSSTVTSNTLDGILISGAATAGNGFSSNFIGLTASGAAAGNGHYGVRISAGAYFNQVGAGCGVCGRLGTQYISGNGWGGVRLETGAISNTVGNLIAGNDIGVNPAGTGAIPNGGPGVDVDNSPHSFIGGCDICPSIATNLIAGNLGPGVRLSNTDDDSVSFFNTIGSAGLGNGGPGVELINTTNTGVFALHVCCNTGAGIAVEGASSTSDLIAPFNVLQNGGLPIDLGNDGHTPNGSHVPPGPDNWVNYPVITATSGSVITGTACLSCTVLIYLATGNPGGPGGGASLLQTATADGAGHWSATLIGGQTSGGVTLQACTAPCSRDFLGGGGSNADTSELSPRLQLWVPLIQR